MSSSRVVRRVSALAGAIRVGPAEGETPDPLARLSPEERAAHERRAAEAAEQTRTLAEARQRGYDEGRARADAEVRSHIDRLAELIDAAQTAYGDAVHATETALIELALTIGERLARARLELPPDGISPLVQAALQGVGATAGVTLRVHPDDRRSLEPFEDRLRAQLESGVEFTIQDDGALAPGGGCVIETTAGQIDASIDTQLNELASHLLNRAGDAPHDRP